MRIPVRLMLCLTVLSAFLLVGQGTATGKIAFIERRGDQVHVRYEYGDGYQLKRIARPERKVQRVRHEHFHFYPHYNMYGVAGWAFEPVYPYAYPFSYR